MSCACVTSKSRSGFHRMEPLVRSEFIPFDVTCTVDKCIEALGIDDFGGSTEPHNKHFAVWNVVGCVCECVSTRLHISVIQQMAQCAYATIKKSLAHTKQNKPMICCTLSI